MISLNSCSIIYISRSERRVKVMPAKGQKSVTVDEVIYNMAKEFLQKHYDELRKYRIKSVSDLFEESLLLFMHLFNTKNIDLLKTREYKWKQE